MTTTYAIRTANGSRTWKGDDIAHAIEQHADAHAGMEGEVILSVHAVDVDADRAERERYVAWLRETLIPDLRESGQDATADDFETCIRYIEGGLTMSDAQNIPTQDALACAQSITLAPLLQGMQDAGETIRLRRTGSGGVIMEHATRGTLAIINADGSGVRYWGDGTPETLHAPDAQAVEVLDACVRGFVCALLWADAEPYLGPEPDKADPGWDLWEERRHAVQDVGETGGLENLEPGPALLDRARELCARFLLRAVDDDVNAFMDAYGDPDGGHPGEYVGHTFYLDAAGHGVSFTDRAWRDDDAMTAVCKRLRDVAKSMGEVEHLCASELADGTVEL